MITIGVIVILNPQASAEERREKKKRALKRRRPNTEEQWYCVRRLQKNYQYFGSRSALISVIGSESRC
jgi:hypothetical protein